jgi:hypothetical protein
MMTSELNEPQQLIGHMGGGFTEVGENPVGPYPIVRVFESLQ